MKPIYTPKGAALEYGELALNLHGTCPHGCYYCYAPTILHKSKADYFRYDGYRPGIVEATRKQLEREGITGKLIHIPFIGDAYPKGYDSAITREIIMLLKSHGNHVQILTKNGADALRDFDILDGEDWFGVTYAGYDIEDYFNQPRSEPGAGEPIKRLAALEIAHDRGIRTWVSCEPVLHAKNVLGIIKKCGYIDKFKIGKLNYHPSDINWHDFGHEVESLCQRLGRDYYIKDALRREMP